MHLYVRFFFHYGWYHRPTVAPSLSPSKDLTVRGYLRTKRRIKLFFDRVISPIMSAVIKKTTRLTGLAVAQNPHRDLRNLYDRILRGLNALPKDYPYRQHTEALVKERSNIVEQNESVSDIEAKINCGQIEELIVQARNELTLVGNMQTWKPWENLVEDAPPYQWTWPPCK